MQSCLLYQLPQAVARELYLQRSLKTEMCSILYPALQESPERAKRTAFTNHFISDDSFKKMIDSGEFLEHAGYVGHYYGTPKKPVLANLEQGRDVILEVETNGAFQVKKAFPELC